VLDEPPPPPHAIIDPANAIPSAPTQTLRRRIDLSSKYNAKPLP
jgi:hypothetical protein